MHPNQAHRQRQQKVVREQVQDNDSYAFFNLLTAPALLDQVESLLPEHRERLFPPTETLSMFLAQSMSADRSCQSAVNLAAVTRLVGGLTPCSVHTGAYCRARQRLPVEMVSTLCRYTGELIADQTPRAWHWKGRSVRLVDGATVNLPDTPDNQRHFPQPGSQAPGLGFPQTRIVALICLASGAVLNVATGPCCGKGGDEQALLRHQFDTLNTGDVLLGDAYYATYFLLCALTSMGIDGVFEQYGARKCRTDFRRGKRLGARDHLIVIKKPAKRPDWMSQEDYDQAPHTLSIRELSVGGRTLVTTLLCPKQYPKGELKQLYRDRWHVELDLRNIKTTLSMQTLSCRTAAMAEKEIWVYLLAYNLIRVLMAQAALLADMRPRQMSFKHTLQLWIAWRQKEPDYDDEKLARLFFLMAQKTVGNRPGRIEPRALKRRPKQFPLLTKPRPIARQQVRLYGHPKKLK